MNTEIRQKLNNFYIQRGIYPDNFRCPNQSVCRQYAYRGKMTETKMSMLGSLYSKKFPKITVVSLDPPEEKDDVFKLPEQRTTEFISNLHDAENFAVERPGPHWAVTQIIVKEVLVTFGYQAKPYSAVVTESYAWRPIENVSAYFSHVNVAKCSMNNPGRGQSNEYVHQLCSRAYLIEELAVLEPDIIISQGSDANRILGELLVGQAVLENHLPMFEIVNLGDKSFLWLPMHHPARQIHKIRAEWPVYIRYIQDWSKN